MYDMRIKHSLKKNSHDLIHSYLHSTDTNSNPVRAKAHISITYHEILALKIIW